MLILNTLNAIPLDQNASTLFCTVDNFIHMRHKFLLLLEQLLYQQPLSLENLIEIDETYINDGFKRI